MAKAKADSDKFDKGDVVVENGWTYTAGTGSVEARKMQEPGVILEATGRTLDEARASADARDQQIRQQAQGQAEQASARAAELRAQADALEGLA